MSDYPASLGDVADVEVRIDQRLSRLERRQESDATVTDEKFAEMRAILVKELEWSDSAKAILGQLEARVIELEKLWLVAQENPELVRELAAVALKGRG